MGEWVRIREPGGPDFYTYSLYTYFFSSDARFQSMFIEMSRMLTAA